MSRSANTDDLTPIEIQAVLDFFFYRMSQETRGQLMRAYPEAYNKLCGREIVQVRAVSDGRVL